MMTWATGRAPLDTTTVIANPEPPVVPAAGTWETILVLGDAAE